MPADMEFRKFSKFASETKRTSRVMFLFLFPEFFVPTKSRPPPAEILLPPLGNMDVLFKYCVDLNFVPKKSAVLSLTLADIEQLSWSRPVSDYACISLAISEGGGPGGDQTYF